MADGIVSTPYEDRLGAGLGETDRDTDRSDNLGGRVGSDVPTAYSGEESGLEVDSAVQKVENHFALEEKAVAKKATATKAANDKAANILISVHANAREPSFRNGNGCGEQPTTTTTATIVIATSAAITATATATTKPLVLELRRQRGYAGQLCSTTERTPNHNPNDNTTTNNEGLASTYAGPRLAAIAQARPALG